MANVVQELRQAVGVGARPSKYKILLSFPPQTGASAGKEVNILCKSATFPSITQTPIEIFTQGRKLVLPGETTYTNSWALEFHQTEGHELRLEFLKWLKAIDDFHNNKHQGDLGALTVDQTIIQLDHKEEDQVQYRFHGLFPSEVGEVSVSDETVNQIEQFGVTFQFTSWTVVE